MVNFSDEVVTAYFHEMRLKDDLTSTQIMALMAVKPYLKLIEKRDIENQKKSEEDLLQKRILKN